MAVIHTSDPSPNRPAPPHIKVLPRLRAMKEHSTQRMMMAAEQATMDLLIQVFDAGYEARKAEEREERALKAEIAVAGAEEKADAEEND